MSNNLNSSFKHKSTKKLSLLDKMSNHQLISNISEIDDYNPGPHKLKAKHRVSYMEDNSPRDNNTKVEFQIDSSSQMTNRNMNF